MKRGRAASVRGYGTAWRGSAPSPTTTRIATPLVPLGHGITDGDTAALMPFGNGAILPSTVKAVKKGSCGRRGELRGEFDLTEELGQLYANTGCGIFGTLNAACSLAEGEALPVGDASEGPAVIRSNISGDEVQEYAVEILKTIPDAPDGENW